MSKWLASGVAVAMALTSFSVAADEPWKADTTRNGLKLELRAVPGSSYEEYRVKTESPASPKAVIDGLWSGLTEDLPSTISKREFLSRSDNEMVVYDLIHTPVVSDRDLVLRIRRTVHADTGVIDVRFQTVEQGGPPPSPDRVRIPAVRGGWTIEPSPSGGSVLTYVCYSEPGGSVPAIFVRGAQKDQVFLDVQRVLRRARPGAH